LTTARIDARFAALRQDNRAAFVAYVMGGDPDLATSLKILEGLSDAGADVIELGFPFSDPIGEGPTIQKAAQRSLAAGTTFDDVLGLARAFRPTILCAVPAHLEGVTSLDPDDLATVETVFCSGGVLDERTRRELTRFALSIVEIFGSSESGGIAFRDPRTTTAWRPFEGITVSSEHIRARAEQELRNLALRLRRRFISIHDDGAALAAAAHDAAVTLAVNLRALLFLRRVVSDEFQPALAIYERAAETFGLDLALLDALKRARSTADATPFTIEQFDRLLATVNKASDIAASMD